MQGFVYVQRNWSDCGGWWWCSTPKGKRSFILTCIRCFCLLAVYFYFLLPVRPVQVIQTQTCLLGWSLRVCASHGLRLEAGLELECVPGAMGIGSGSLCELLFLYFRGASSAVIGGPWSDFERRGICVLRVLGLLQ